MKLVVGLGNPGQKYKGTRHNVGFNVIAFLAERYGIDRPKGKFNAEIAETRIANEKIILLSPLTFMNLSGRSVKAAIDFFKLDLANLILVCDDLALDVGRLRIKPSGSAGGQKGLANTIDQLGSNQFARLRIGIGKPPAHWETADYVLGQFPGDEKIVIDQAVTRAAQAIEVWATSGVQVAMNQFNADPNQKPDPKPKPKPKSSKSKPNNNTESDPQ